MNTSALTSRGVVHDSVHRVTIEPRDGFVSVCTRRLPEPLGPAESLHALKLMVGGILTVRPELSETVSTVVATARTEASASRSGAA